MGKQQGRLKYNSGGGAAAAASDRRCLLHPAHAQVSAADHLADLDEEDVVWSSSWLGGGADDDSNSRPGPAGTFQVQAAASPPARQHQVVAASAPVAVPEWPSTMAEWEEYGGADESEWWVPPHEYLQRRRRGGRAGAAAAASVLEGAGRTLKGRDITRVRDAVWSNTGFLG